MGVRWEFGPEKLKEINDKVEQLESEITKIYRKIDGVKKITITLSEGTKDTWAVPSNTRTYRYKFNYTQLGEVNKINFLNAFSLINGTLANNQAFQFTYVLDNEGIMFIFYNSYTSGDVGGVLDSSFIEIYYSETATE